MGTLLSSGVANAQDSGTIRKLKETNTITVASREVAIPLNYLGDNQVPVGYGIDICLSVVDHLKKKLNLPNLKVAYSPVNSTNRMPLLANGTTDIQCAADGNLEDRWKQVSFSNSYFMSDTKYLAKKASNLKSIEDLKGKTVVSTAGTLNLKLLYEANEKQKLGMKILSSTDHAEGFLMVETGRAEAFALDDVLLASMIASSKDPSAFALSTGNFGPALPYGPMIRKDDPEFKKLVDEATSELYRSPRIKELYDKWFMKPIQPKGATMNLPMSETLAKALAKPSDSWDLSKYPK
ncbi:MAG: amino acid ABC transporter substrate-binding protein [Verrucomicrobiaceae bacterium]|nr:MAG: amino acid ABC transporter substrate-binding protein [Verrucomicrobiaceae bacterium]